MATMFSEEDIRQITHHGLSPEAVENQVENFKNGFPFLPVAAAAVPGDGITVLPAERMESLAAAYDAAVQHCKVVKFVPASGAATRMFKDLFAFVNEDKRGKSIDELLSHLDEFAFAQSLEAFLPEGADDKAIVRNIIVEGLCYGSEPKGLVLFHKYPDEVRTAVEEHLTEGAAYASSGGKVDIHFTVSDEHRRGFEELLDRVLPKYEKRFGVKYGISFSEQKSSTDTVAVNPDNTLFRNADGSLLFRPAGHGALIENLNDIDADIIFIKNIDNVTTDALRGDTVRYKRVLAGLLVELQKGIFDRLGALERGEAGAVGSAARFVEENLGVKLPAGFASSSEADRKAVLTGILDRPLRVCGMVRNEGEPGGGPFWVKNADGTCSLQIAESSQIAPQDAPLMNGATHFNPVDLVCGVKNARGGKFDLREYVDPATGFISSKSKDGRELKAQELPGLWNGAMARWNTVFVEVPVSTFTPVKVVNDLLRPQHR